MPSSNRQNLRPHKRGTRIEPAPKSAPQGRRPTSVSHGGAGNNNAVLLALLAAFVVLVAGALVIRGCVTQPPAAEEAPEVVEETGPATVHFVAVGDNLPEIEIANFADAQAGEVGDGEYDYTALFSPIKSYIESADLAYVKQETHLGGDNIGPKGYPSFNSPQEFGDAEVAAGFDVALCASNHALDRGMPGIESALGYWRSAHPEVLVTGIADSVVSGGRSLAHAVQRAVLGYDSESMHSFAYVELKRLSEMLGRLAECSHGYPFEYAGPQLYRDYDGEFADAPYWCLLGDDKAGIEVMTRTDDGLAWRQKTNAEMGVEYAAWTSDLHAASVALGLYADWVIRQRGYMRHIGDIERIAAGSKPVDAVDYVGRRLNDGNGERSIGYDAGGWDGEGARSSSLESDFTKSFVMTWKWLGDNFESLWD